MIATRAVLVFVLLLVVGHVGAEEAPPTAEQIEAAIEQLGADAFTVRTQATDFLWKAGRAAEPALRNALNSKDPEVLFRARQILEKFNYGIYPDTPPEVLQLIDQYRSGNDAAKRNVVRRLLEIEQFRTLMALLRIESDESLRRQMAGGFLANAQKVLPELFRQGDFQQAEQLLELASANSTGMRHYAAYLAVQGTLDEKIRELEERIVDALPDSNAQLLVYLWRAKGDVDRARQAAEATANDALIKATLYEARDWQALADMHKREDPFLPANADPFGRRSEDIEFLGFAAAFHRLAGRQEAYQNAIDRIKSRAERENRDIWYCAEALLINDQPDEAIELFKRHQPLSAFKLLCAQERYVEAFDAVNLPKPGGDFDPWIDQLVQDATAADKELHKRFYLGLEAAKALYRLGETDTAKQLFTRLATAVSEDGDDHQRLRAVCEEQAKLGMWQQAAEQLAPVFADGLDSLALDTLFSKQAAIAQVWWAYFSNKHRDEPIPARVARIRSVLRFDRQPVENLGQLIADAKAEADQLDEHQLPSWYAALGETCLKHDRPDLAMPFFQTMAEMSDAPAMMQLGDLLAEDEKWEAAAKWYRKAWEQDRQVAAMYFAGRALSRAGKETAGAEMMKQATLLPLADEKIRQQFAQELKQRGLVEEAKSQWQLIVRTGEFNRWYVNNAAQNLGNAASGQNDLLAAKCWERLALSVLQTSSAFVEMEGYLTLPHLVHKARALGLFRAGEVDKAVEEVRLSHSAKPGDSKFIEDIVPELEKAGRTEDADALFDKSYSLLENVCQVFPHSAFHHNNLAWMSARCDRRLNEALAHAERAVELAPDNAAYIDTLAETHFRLGHVDEAIKLAKKCLEISPDNTHFQRQWKRFQDQ